jgi:hypothetical protein
MTHQARRTFRGLVFVTLISGYAISMQAKDKCSNNDLRGSFGFTLTGNNIAAGVQYALTGRFVADGNGHFTGGATQSVSGAIGRFKFQGAYSVTPDCSGTAVLDFGDGGATANLDFVLANDGKDVFIIDSNNGTVETGIAKKQFVHRRGGVN